MTCVRPVDSMWVRTPSSGEAGTAAPGVPFAGALIDDDPTGPGVAYRGLHAPTAIAAARASPAASAIGRRLTRDPRPSRCSRA